MDDRVRRAWQVVAMLIGWCLACAQPAWADCQPATPASGDTVTCTGSIPSGFAPGVDALTINILAGAVVGDDGTAGFTLGQGNRVTNFGTIVTGDNTRAIQASGDGNIVVNGGTIATGAFGTAIDMGFSSNNTITNNGSIAVGDFGMLIAAATNNVIVNNGAMSTAGDGIVVDSANRVTNAGTIVTTGSGIAISLGTDNTVINTGTIRVDCCGTAIFGTDGNVITNAGSILLGSSALGIQVGTTSTVVNGGLIAGGDGAIGIVAGDANLITNDGTIRVGVGGFAIQAQYDNTIVNNGLIAGGDGSAGVFVMDNSSVTNNGTIRVGSGGIAVVTISSTGVSLVNNGTIDGNVLLGACGCAGTNSFLNNGLLTITDLVVPVGFGGYQVGGLFTQTAAGTTTLRIAPGANVNDAFAADSAVLDGRLHLIVTPGLYDGTTSYQVLTTTTAITGAFAQITTSAFFDVAAVYGGTDLTVTLIRRSFADARGATPNQRAVGAALEAAYSLAATGDAAILFGSVAASASAAVLDALSGEAAAAAQNANFAIGGQFLSLLLRQTELARTNPASSGFARAPGGQRVQLAGAPALADAAPAQGVGRPGPWSLWMAGFGGHVSRHGDATPGAAGQSIGFAGVATGLDYRVSPDLLLGAAVAASGGGYTVTGRAAEGDARNFHLGVYAGFTHGALRIDGALSYAYGDFVSTRVIALGAPERASAAYGGHQFGGRLEAGWRLQAAGYGLTPFAGINVQALRQNGYSESTRVIATGAPGFMGLSVAGRTTWSVRSELGGQVDRTFRLDDGTTLRPRLRLAWAHEFSTDRQVTSSLNALPGTRFTVSGARPARDAALLSAGLDLGIATNVTGFAQVDGEFSRGGSSVAGAGGLRITW